MVPQRRLLLKITSRQCNVYQVRVQPDSRMNPEAGADALRKAAAYIANALNDFARYAGAVSHGKCVGQGKDYGYVTSRNCRVRRHEQDARRGLPRAAQRHTGGRRGYSP